MGHFDRLQLVGRITYYLGWMRINDLPVRARAKIQVRPSPAFSPCPPGHGI